MFYEQYGRQMEYDKPPELFPSNRLTLHVWDYVSDQLILIGDRVAVRIEAILAVMKFLKIPDWRAKDIVKKIQYIVKRNVKINTTLKKG